MSQYNRVFEENLPGGSKIMPCAFNLVYSKIDLEFSYLQGIIPENWLVRPAVWLVFLLVILD